MSAAFQEQLTLALRHYTSATRLYDLTVGHDRSTQFLVEAFTAQDAIQGIGVRDVIVLSTDPFIDLFSLLDQPATLAISLAGGTRTHFSGIIIEACLLSYNGGYARFALKIAPWMWRMEQVRNCRVWEEKTVMEIIDDVFRAYYPQARWRWSVETPRFMHDAGARSYCCQYRETDFDFIRRLLIEEGLCWRFEEDKDGLCCVLFSDSTNICAVPEDESSRAGGGVRYHGVRPGECQDTVQALYSLRSMVSTSVTVLSTDYKQRNAIFATSPGRVANGASTQEMEVFDCPGAYAYVNAAQARRYADLHMETLEARSLLWEGTSTVRTLRAGTQLTITDLPMKRLGPRPAFMVTRVTSMGLNNLPSSVQQALAGMFKPAIDALDTLHAMAHAHDDELAALMRAQVVQSGYANCFDAIPADRPWRAQLPGAAAGRAPQPTAYGSQTAIVVGPNGSKMPHGANEMFCDRLGLVRIRFHWQEETASCWVRVSQRAAGASKCQFLPRIGQEVHVMFMEDNIDRPVIVGALYNGQGEGGNYATPGGKFVRKHQYDLFAGSLDHRYFAQGNVVGANSPVWHGNSTDYLGHRNAAAQWGIRSKEFGGSGYNQLVFDDTDAQGRIQLKCSNAGTELNLGHLIHTADNYRGSFRGLGAELRTDAYGAVRAGAGFLITSYKLTHNAAAREPAGENAAGVAMVKQAAQLAARMHEAATTHDTVGLAAHGEPMKAMLAAIAGEVGRDGKPAKDDLDVRLPHLAQPVIAIAAQGGLHAAVGQDLQLAANDTIALLSGADTQFATGGQLRVHAGEAIGMLGGAVQPGEGGLGLQLIAAQDDIVFQAQSDTLTIQARDEVNVISANAHIDWAAAKSISLSTAGGANITIEGGNITVQCPGKLTIHAGMKSFDGPARTSYKLPVLPVSTIVPVADQTLESTFAFDQLTLVAKNFTKAEFVMFVAPVFGFDIPAETYIKLWDGLRTGAIAQPVIKLMTGGHYPASFDNETRSILVHQASAERAASNNDESWELLTALLHEFGHYIDLVLRADLTAKNPDGSSSIAADASEEEGAKFAYGIAFFDFGDSSNATYAHYQSPKFSGSLKVNYNEARKIIQQLQNKEAQGIESKSGTVEHFGAGKGEHYKERPSESFGHQSIEFVLKKVSPYFDEKVLKQIYFGNWLRDYSQLIDPSIVRKPDAPKDFPRKISRKELTELVDVLAELEFVVKNSDKKIFTVTEKLLGVYRPVEHIDNPKNDALNAPDPKSIDADFQKKPTAEYFVIDYGSSMRNYILHSKQYMREMLGKAISSGPTAEGFRQLGAALHVLEDYFAHSNYVELSLRKAGYSKVLIWTTEDNCKRKTPVVTGMFSSDDVIASTAGLIADTLFKVEWELEEEKPGHRTKADRIITILLKAHSDERLLASYESYLGIRDQIAALPGQKYLKIAMHNTVGMIANVHNWVLSTLIHLVGNSVDDQQVVRRGDPNMNGSLHPSHSQLAKDHDDHPFHTIAATLAQDAVRHVGKSIAARWWGGDTSADPAGLAASFIAHPLDTNRQDELVRTWATTHLASIKRGESATEWEALEKAHKKEILEAINSGSKKTKRWWGYVNSNYQMLFDNKNQVRK
jgi:type VI secretion system secreted protein VgrG